MIITDNTRPHYLDNKKVYHHKKTDITGASDEGLDLDLLHGRETWIKRYMLVDLALFSGLRVAEITNLKIGDINLKAKDTYLIVRKGKRGKKGMFI